MTPQEEFELMLEYAGVKRWHKEGYKGKGINVLNCEVSRHGDGTEEILKRVAPESTIICGTTGILTKGDTLISAKVEFDDLTRYDLHEYIKANNIHILNASRSGINNECIGWNQYCERMKDDTEVVIFNAAGNEYEGNGETLSTQFPHSVAILVGALAWNAGKPRRMIYSSVGDELDFMAFGGLIGGTHQLHHFWQA